ncbi:MAG: hypothetical protein HY918_01630 [Candidatus Doudnabacteria bacterium]|nr:hypothetical protein [Candidatus Doudnabacteria bacterium]
MAKKSFYIFLASLLGVILFLVLHRIVMFGYLYLLAGGYVGTDMGYAEFIMLDYFTLMLTLMFGAWYGIWIGMYWYERVYELKSHPGFVAHLSSKFFNGNAKKIESKMVQVRERLEEDLWQMEDLAKVSLESASVAEPIKRRVIKRKTAVKKAAPKV